ncbi:MAG TPA: DUF2169 domain-containing protein [Polyangia bacterium]|nr:DUF2169 domain-containing protein [Polyangia bacterium]
MSQAVSRVSAVTIQQRKEGGWLLGIVGKRSYEVTRGRCYVAANQTSLVEEPDVDDTGRLHHDSDLIISRLAADVILEGTARAPRRTNAFTVTLRIGDFVREFSVVGERRLEARADGRLAFSQAEQVDEVPLTWDEAYGGVDRAAIKDIGDPFMKIAKEMGSPLVETQSLYAYPRNPFGKGYLIEASPAAIDACRLPRLEYGWSRVTPENVVRTHFVTWPLAPIPAGLSWLGYTAFPRSAQLGLPAPLYDEAKVPPGQMPEVKSGLLRPIALDRGAPVGERLDVPGLAQGAAVGMRAPSILPGAEVQLTNAHPQEPLWSFRLPNEIPRMALRLPGQQRAEELRPQIHQLSIEPDKSRVTVLWVATRPLDQPLTPGQTEAVGHGVIWS